MTIEEILEEIKDTYENLISDIETEENIYPYKILVKNYNFFEINLFYFTIYFLC